MAREYARVRSSIWNNPDFTKLTTEAQRLYLLVLSQPLLTQAGVVPYQPRRWASLAAGSSQQGIRKAAVELVDSRFVVVDEDTEEFMVRTFVRYDNVLMMPNVARAMVKAYRTIISTDLRGTFLVELKALRTDDPTLKGWDVPECLELSDEPLPEGFAEGLGKGFTEPMPHSLDLSPNPNPNPTPSTSEAVAVRSDVETICSHLADRIENNGSKRPAVTERWRTSARLLLDADRHTVEQVTRAIDWCQADEFWRSNILSMPTLREKYDQLRLAAQRPVAPAQKLSGPARALRLSTQSSEPTREIAQ